MLKQASSLLQEAVAENEYGLVKDRGGATTKKVADS